MTLSSFTPNSRPVPSPPPSRPGPASTHTLVLISGAHDGSTRRMAPWHEGLSAARFAAEELVRLGHADWAEVRGRRGQVLHTARG